MNTDEWLDPIPYATTEYTIRNTMKGPWESIAAGREKGVKAVRELVNEVAGLLPYEKHLMDILKV